MLVIAPTLSGYCFGNVLIVLITYSIPSGASRTSFPLFPLGLYLVYPYFTLKAAVPWDSLRGDTLHIVLRTVKILGHLFTSCLLYTSDAADE